MRKDKVKRLVICAIALFVLVLPCTLNAQSFSEYDLHLNMDSSFPDKQVDPFSRHFELSLGNQMVESPSNIDFEFDENVSAVSSDRHLNKGPVITLNNCYQMNAIGYKDISDNGFAIAGDTGKWQIYGKFEQKYVTQLDTEKSYQDRSVANMGFRGSSRSLMASDASDDFKTSVSSSYSLEAVYSFKPTLKGRVAFKHSAIDTFDSEKTIQLEGVVEPKPNVQIKAGFDNEFGPELGNESKSPKDTRVWTEFILKF